jgi:CheY-like chemotaxis protein
MAKIEENAKAQGALVDDLLDISRIIQGKLSLEPRLIDPVAVAREAIDALQAAATAKQIALELEAPFDGSIRADPGRLRQVIVNLLSNSIKFSPAGSTVSTTVRAIGRAPRRCQIIVRDRGVGIRQEFMAKLFDPFSQADPSPTRVFGGLGLGLAIVRNLVALHGGTISAESAGEGQGATFTVELPDVVDERVGERPSVPEALVGAPDQLAEVRILVVDDLSDAREAIAELLSAFGAVVTTAGGTAEAFEAVLRDPPDLLITDIAMPGEDGYALLRRVRASQRPELRGLPVVALTAYAGREDRARAEAAGFRAHIAKPFEVLSMVNTLAELVHADARASTPH